MATYTIKGGIPDYSQPPKWYMWEIDFTDIAADEDPTVTIDPAVPAGIVVLDARLAVTRAETVSTSPVAGVQLGTQPLVALATSLATETITAGTAAELVDGIQDGASATQALALVSTRSGSAPGVFPKVIVAVLMGRFTK